MPPIVSHRTIEPARIPENGYCLISHGEYGSDSVMEGYPYRSIDKFYDTLEEAIAENPNVEVLDHITYDPYHQPELPSAAPGWFNELDAGERWDYDY